MKIKKSILLILLIFVSINIAKAQASRFNFGEYKNTSGEILKYRVLYPDYDTIRKYPLVIFLHGLGERGDDNKAQLKWGVTNFATDRAMITHPAFVIAPQCPKNYRWSNAENHAKGYVLKLKEAPSKPIKLLIELIHKFIKKYNVDTNRIYITGLSMGGYGTYDAISHYPDLFAAAVPVCGVGDISKAKTIAHIPMWIFQGNEDAVVSPRHAEEMYDALKKAGANPGFTMYPSVGHFSWIAAYSDPMMMSWLFKQHK